MTLQVRQIFSGSVDQTYYVFVISDVLKIKMHQLFVCRSHYSEIRQIFSFSQNYYMPVFSMKVDYLIEKIK